MANLLSWQGILPSLDPSAWVAPTATVIGQVEIGAQSSVWFGAVLRGDVDWIRIGARTNVQDGAILHCSTGLGPTVIGDDVTIGHMAVVHGCTVHSRCLIGIGATVLDQAVVHSHVMVAAGAVVTPRTVLESGFLYAGIPAKRIRPLTEAEIESFSSGAAHYAKTAAQYRKMQP